jgi:hypothetical protein
MASPAPDHLRIIAPATTPYRSPTDGATVGDAERARARVGVVALRRQPGEVTNS